MNTTQWRLTFKPLFPSLLVNCPDSQLRNKAQMRLSRSIPTIGIDFAKIQKNNDSAKKKWYLPFFAVFFQ